MQDSTHYRLRTRTLLYGIVMLIASLLLGVVFVLAVDTFPGLPNDGRINIVHHFGGDALYCVDANHNPTGQYSSDDFGGMKLLNMNGQELWFVPAADIEAAAALAEATPDLGVLVFTGPGTYGPSYLYVFADAEEDGIIKFQLSAFDEWGKVNSMEFKFCEPVGPIGGETEGSDEPDLPFCDPEAEGEFCECAFDACVVYSDNANVSISECLDTFYPLYNGLCRTKG